MLQLANQLIEELDAGIKAIEEEGIQAFIGDSKA
jgi:hypothetical protein